MWSPFKKDTLGTPTPTSSEKAEDYIFPIFSPLSRLHPHQMFGSFFSSRSRGSWIPAIDLAEGDTAYTLIADLPEVKKEDLRVYTEAPNVICISGNRLHATKHDDHQMLVVERGAGRFERCFELLTPVDDAQIQATFTDYTLSVTIPKVQGKKLDSANTVPIN